MPDGVDKNVYVPTGFYKVRLYFIFILSYIVFNSAHTRGVSSIILDIIWERKKYANAHYICIKKKFFSESSLHFSLLIGLNVGNRIKYYSQLKSDYMVQASYIRGKWIYFVYTCQSIFISVPFGTGILFQ